MAKFGTINYPKTREQHGMTGTPTHQCWLDMRHRCNNKDNAWFHRYGARGIGYDPSWNSFICFLNDMGEKPEGLTLDRIDNEKGYSKENCRWATAKEQSNNTVRCMPITVQGVTMTRAEACAKYNISKGQLASRLSKGWSHDDACLTPGNPVVKRSPRRKKT